MSDLKEEINFFSADFLFFVFTHAAHNRQTLFERFYPCTYPGISLDFRFHCIPFEIRNECNCRCLLGESEKDKLRKKKLAK